MKYTWLAGFWPAPGTTDRFEKMRGSVGALFGLVLCGLCTLLALGNSAAAIWLIAPMGASAVLLFAVPSSPLAQPWSIIGGNLVAAVIGVTCAKFIGSPVLAAAIAGALAIGAMSVLRCLHPPSGAVALTAVLGGPAVHALGYGFVLSPVLLNSVLLLAAALFFNNATGRRYPHLAQATPAIPHGTKDPVPTARTGLTTEDLDTVLKRYNQVLDISRSDLEAILRETEQQVYLRRFGVTHCGDIMSRDVVSVEFGTDLQSAWDALHIHSLQALPVVGRGMHVVGILSRADFLRHANINHRSNLAERLRYLLTPVRHSHSIKPEVVGQVMRTTVHTATVDQPIVELVGLMSDGGVHVVPVVDAAGKLAGILTQSDLVAALYENNLQAAAGAPAGTFAPLDALG